MKKAINIKCSIDDFFTNYLLVTKPYHGLTDTELQYTARFMYYYNEYSDSIDKEDLIFELLFSTSTRKQIREDLKVEKIANFNTVLNSLKKKNVILTEELDGDSKYKLHKNYCIKLKDSKKASVEYAFTIKEKVV